MKKQIIDLGTKEPGLYGLLSYNKTVGRGIIKTLNYLLVEDSCLLSRGERELIATYVAKLTGCSYQYFLHLHTARILLTQEGKLEQLDLMVEREISMMDSKLASLLQIAYATAKPQMGVSMEISSISARDNGALDNDIFTTVAIAASVQAISHYVKAFNDIDSADRTDFSKLASYIVKNGYKEKEKELEAATPA